MSTTCLTNGPCPSSERVECEPFKTKKDAALRADRITSTGASNSIVLGGMYYDALDRRSDPVLYEITVARDGAKVEKIAMPELVIVEDCKAATAP